MDTVGYDRTVFGVEGPSTCERPASVQIVAAQTAAATGIRCPDGCVYDFLLSECFRCPEGSAKNVFRA